jgi:hypothetical protein
LELLDDIEDGGMLALWNGDGGWGVAQNERDFIQRSQLRLLTPIDWAEWKRELRLDRVEKHSENKWKRLVGSVPVLWSARNNEGARIEDF